MKKLYLIIISILIIMFIISCGNALNPIFYNRGKGSYGGELNKPPVDRPEDIPEDQDPFKKDEEYNDPDYGGFNASVFDKWLFKSSFRGDKLPVYNFLTQDSRYWIPGGVDWNKITANYYKANDGENEADGYSISGMTVYKYDAANPLYDNNGYLEGRMERFRFYSIQGRAVIVDLKQYLIAVDTYSKFIFAFGKITKTDTAVNGDKVPIAFEAIEYHGDRDFYEYDPIGYVKSDGSVVLYPHYQKEFVKSPTDYSPQVHGYPSMATHSPTGEGHSPYYVMSDAEASEDDQKKYKDDIATLTGKTYKWRDYSGYQKSPTGDKDQINLEEWISSGYLGKSLILYSYSIENNGEKITVSQQEFQSSSVSSSKDYYLNKITTSEQAIYTNSQDGSSIYVKIIESNGKKTISVGGNILDENFQDYGPIFVDRAKNTEFKYSGSFYLTYASSFVEHFLGADIRDLTYKFNDNGTEYTMSFYYKGKGVGTKEEYREYRFKLARFDSSAANTWTAKYECLDEDATLGKYTRVVFRNGSGTENPGPNEVGTAMRTSMTLHAIDFPESPTVNSGLDLYADRIK